MPDPGEVLEGLPKEVLPRFKEKGGSSWEWAGHSRQRCSHVKYLCPPGECQGRGLAEVSRRWLGGEPGLRGLISPREESVILKTGLWKKSKKLSPLVALFS